MRRSSFEIEMDILLILAASPHGITRLMYGSNTSLIRLRIFLKSLLDKGLISEAITKTKHGNKNRIRYSITSEGLELSKHYRFIKTVLVD